MTDSPLFAFQPSAVDYSLGVEVEVQLLDPATWELAPLAQAFLAALPPAERKTIKGEFLQSMIEVATPVCPDPPSAATELRRLLGRAQENAAQAKAIAFFGSLHPASPWRWQRVSDRPRYQEIAAELQVCGQRLITQGLHVHIGITDADRAARLCDCLRPHLPTLLALSAASPFYEGADTGFHSYRAVLLADLPRSGLPSTFGGWSRCQQLLTAFRAAGHIQTIREVWWDVRPHCELGTVEVRICDIPMTFRELTGLVALVHALAVTLDQAEEPPLHLPHEAMLANRWAAARHGLEAAFIANASRPAATVCREAASHLFDLVEPAARAYNGWPLIEHLAQTMADHGTGAERLRSMHKAHNGSFAELLRAWQKGFWQ